MMKLAQSLICGFILVNAKKQMSDPDGTVAFAVSYDGNTEKMDTMDILHADASADAGKTSYAELHTTTATGKGVASAQSASKGTSLGGLKGTGSSSATNESGAKGGSSGNPATTSFLREREKEEREKKQSCCKGKFNQKHHHATRNYSRS